LLLLLLLLLVLVLLPLLSLFLFWILVALVDRLLRSGGRFLLHAPDFVLVVSFTRSVEATGWRGFDCLFFPCFCVAFPVFVRQSSVHRRGRSLCLQVGRAVSLVRDCATERIVSKGLLILTKRALQVQSWHIDS